MSNKNSRSRFFQNKIKKHQISTLKINKYWTVWCNFSNIFVKLVVNARDAQKNRTIFKCNSSANFSSKFDRQLYRNKTHESTIELHFETFSVDSSTMSNIDWNNIIYLSTSTIKSHFETFFGEDTKLIVCRTYISNNPTTFILTLSELFEMLVRTNRRQL